MDSERQQRFADTDYEVRAATYSPDGAFIAWGDSQGTVTLCERVSRKVLSKEVKAHAPLVHDVKMSPDGTLLASCGADSTIKLWRVQSDGLQKLRRRCAGTWATSIIRPSRLTALDWLQRVAIRL